MKDPGQSDIAHRSNLVSIGKTHKLKTPLKYGFHSQWDNQNTQGGEYHKMFFFSLLIEPLQTKFKHDSSSQEYNPDLLHEPQDHLYTNQERLCDQRAERTESAVVLCGKGTHG